MQSLTFPVEAGHKFVAPALGFVAIGVAFALVAGFAHGQLSVAASSAITEMLAPNALGMLAIVSLFSTGLVTTVLGRPTNEMGGTRRLLFTVLARNPALFTASFCAPMFWFFVGITAVMAFLVPIAVTALLIIFLASLAALGLVAALYVELLSGTYLTRAWRCCRDGRAVGLFLLVVSCALIRLLPVVPTTHGH